MDYIRLRLVNFNSSVFFTTQKECIPYSEQRCKSIGEEFGWEYSSVDDGRIKGCYIHITGRFKNEIFFGTGGTDDQNKMEIKEIEGMARPMGIGCQIGSLILIYKIEEFVSLI